jgi:hypothetical protein
MWLMKVEEVTCSFLIIWLHAWLSANNEVKYPFTNQPGLLNTVMLADTYDVDVAIESTGISYHAASWVCPKGTYGISQQTLVIHNLHQGCCE